MKTKSEEIILTSGQKITKYTLENDKSMRVEIISLGATLIKVITPDEKGNLENVVLGWQDLNVYEEHPGNFGAIIGRVAGRISEGKATIQGETYHFPINHFKNTLHGGNKGFHTKNWEGKLIEKEDAVGVLLSCISEDGEEGFPGELKVEVTYTLNNDNQLIIDYFASTTKETLVNLTNHSYFNLSGDAKEDILNQEVYIDSDEIYEVDEELIPTGKLISVDEMPCFDFRKPKKIGRDINVDNTLLKYGNGYDHIWKLREQGKAATLYDPISKRYMEVTTSEPCVVVYTMNYADADIKLDNGKRQLPRYAICFETQKAAVGYNEVNKEAILLKPEDIYKQQTIFSFSVKN